MTAFDSLAANYDAAFTTSPIAAYLRQQIHNRLLNHFKSGDHLLELGCGTGEDARFLGERGIHITGTDVSREMLVTAAEKNAHLPHVHFQYLDLNQPYLEQNVIFDGVFSNFGPLNCIGEWKTLAAWLAHYIKPGGVAGFALMSRYCLWEMGWHSLHGDFNTAFRRLNGHANFQSSDDDSLTIYYPSVKRFADDFKHYFRKVYLQPLGLFLPPSDSYPVLEKRSNWLKRLIGLEKRFGKIPQLANLADHYWIEFERL